MNDINELTCQCQPPTGNRRTCMALDPRGRSLPWMISCVFFMKRCWTHQYPKFTPSSTSGAFPDFHVCPITRMVNINVSQRKKHYEAQIWRKREANADAVAKCIGRWERGRMVPGDVLGTSMVYCVLGCAAEGYWWFHRARPRCCAGYDTRAICFYF